MSAANGSAAVMTDSPRRLWYYPEAVLEPGRDIADATPIVYNYAEKDLAAFGGSFWIFPGRNGSLP
jgi:hypothetical protein